MIGPRPSGPGRRAVLLALLASACTSAEPTYYTLAPTPPATPAALPPKAPRTVELRRPGLAGYLDRPEIVRAGGDYQLRVAGGERWGEPLGDLIGRVAAENLTTRLPGLSVFTQAGGITSEADAVIEIDVQRFDAETGGPVTSFAIGPAIPLIVVVEVSPGMIVIIIMQCVPSIWTLPCIVAKLIANKAPALPSSLRSKLSMEMTFRPCIISPLGMSKE